MRQMIYMFAKKKILSLMHIIAVIIIILLENAIQLL